MDIDFSPTGREFVTGSYDRTVSCLSFVSIPLSHCSSRTLLVSNKTSVYRLEFSSIMVVTVEKSTIQRECKGLVSSHLDNIIIRAFQFIESGFFFFS